MEKLWYILIKLYKMQEAYKFIELINILILISGIFNYIFIKTRNHTYWIWLIFKFKFYIL
jgi:hypothetical protein